MKWLYEKQKTLFGFGGIMRETRGLKKCDVFSLEEIVELFHNPHLWYNQKSIFYGAPMTENETEIALRVGEAFVGAYNLFEKNQRRALAYLRKINRALGKRPIDLILNEGEVGLQKVLSEIGRAEHGIY